MQPTIPAGLHLQPEPQIVEVASHSASQFANVWKRFRKHHLGFATLIVLILVILLTVLVPILSPFDLYTANPLQRYAPAGAVDHITGNVHWLGTDYLGRDVALRLFTGGRTSLFVALLSTLLIVVIGSFVGSVAGYFGGWTDSLLMRVTDFFLALPLLPMYLFAIRLLKSAPALSKLWSNNESNTFLTVATIVLIFTLFGWMGLARLVRGSILSLRSQAFVEAAVALGASNKRIILRHLLPNTIAPILVAAMFSVSDFIILEAIVAYFNQGISDPPLPSLGNMSVANMGYVNRIANLNPFDDVRAYLFLLPCLLILISVLCINYVGDTLRDALDPHQDI